MIDTKCINDMVKKVMEGLPPGLKSMPKEIESNLKSVLHGVFGKLDLVTREEFEAQAGVLRKTRKKLQALEKKLKELEEEQQK